MDLSGTNIGLRDRTIVLADAMKHSSTITHLNLSCNYFEGGCFLSILAEAIKHDSTIRQLDLSENSLSDVGLGDDGLNDDACTELAEAIKHYSTIIQLDLSKNHVSDGNVTALADAIKHNSTIRQLDLSENELELASIIALHWRTQLKKFNDYTVEFIKRSSWRWRLFCTGGSSKTQFNNNAVEFVLEFPSWL